MRKIFNSSYLYSKSSASADYSFNKNDDDTKSTSITIIQPVENETVQLAEDDSVTIKVIAQDVVNILEMEIEVKSESGVTVFSDKEDLIENQSYTCIEDFYLTKLTKKTMMTLYVGFKDEFKNGKSKTINFYVTP